MEPDGRLFYCCRCHCQVIICSSCDRGQIYCGPACSKQARHSGCRAAAQRYQKTRKGRVKHAHRQQHYRARQRATIKKVTHQGSPEKPIHDVLSPLPSPLNQGVSAEHTSVFHCHFCQCAVSHYLRHDFIHRNTASVVTSATYEAQGP